MVIKGVVFNEMKGVFADSQNHFARNLYHLLLPSHTYGVESGILVTLCSIKSSDLFHKFLSGGLPENIPDLTWQNLRDFHAKHYNPSNAKFYAYGRLPLEQHLSAIESYLPAEKKEKSKREK